MRAENKEIFKRLKNVEEEFEHQTDEEVVNESEKVCNIRLPLEGLFSCKYFYRQFGERKHFEVHMKIHQENKNHNVRTKCSDCIFISTKELILNEHIKTMRSVLSEEFKVENKTKEIKIILQERMKKKVNMMKLIWMICFKLK